MEKRTDKIFLPFLKATRSFFECMMPLAKNEYASYTSKKTSIFYIFYWYLVFELMFGRRQNSKTAKYFLPGFSSLKKTFGFRSSEWLDQKWQQEVFSDTLPKNVSLKIGLF